MGKLATKVYKHNKRGIDVHFLNQQPRESIRLRVSRVFPGQGIFVRAKAKPVMQQTKSKARKLLEETTLYYGQPIGTRLNDLFDQYVRESCSAGTGKRKRNILVVSDGMPCKHARNR